MGHMNVMWYVGKFDEATWQVFTQIGVTPSYMRDGMFGMAGVQQNLTYKRELMAGDAVEVRSHILEVRERVIRMVHTMREIEGGTVAALCDLTAVHLDRRSHKACAFPDRVRRTAAGLITPAAETT